jgi:hypothetical protein
MNEAFPYRCVNKSSLEKKLPRRCLKMIRNVKSSSVHSVVNHKWMKMVVQVKGWSWPLVLVIVTDLCS